AKRGPGTLLLEADNVYTGATDVYEGLLLVNGAQPGSPVTVHDHGTLGGKGTVGILAAESGGTVSPGVSGPGLLTAASANLQATSAFAVELNGELPGVSYDQLAVNGAVSLDGSTLNLSVGFSPDPGDQFTIVENRGAGAVSGTFAGLPEGASVRL